MQVLGRQTAGVLETGVKAVRRPEVAMPSTPSAPKEEFTQEELLDKLEQLRHSYEVISQCVSNQWSQEEVDCHKDFVGYLVKVVRINGAFIRNLVNEPYMKRIRVGLEFASMTPFRDMVMTGENWAEAPHHLARLVVTRNGQDFVGASLDEETEVEKTSVTLQFSGTNSTVAYNEATGGFPEVKGAFGEKAGTVTVLFAGNRVCEFEVAEGETARYFVS